MDFVSAFILDPNEIGFKGLLSILALSIEHTSSIHTAFTEFEHYIMCHVKLVVVGVIGSWKKCAIPSLLATFSGK